MADFAEPTGPIHGSSSFDLDHTSASEDFEDLSTMALAQQRRISKPLTFRNVFCGRETEILKLEGIFRRTASGVKCRYPNLVLIGGTSGAGKTALVSKLKHHLRSLEEEFFWISGKFEEGQQQATQQQQSIISDTNSTDSKAESTDSFTMGTLHPFAAIVDAFSVFCQELEEEEPETLEEVKADILEAVNDQGAVLTYMIPSLTKIIGKQAEARAGRDYQAQPSEMRRFHFVFRNFIQALASSVRSAVLVLDDIHRADAASLELLLSLMTTELKHVMFIGTYRSDEVDDEEHRLTRWIKRIEDAQTMEQSTGQSTSASANQTNGRTGNTTVAKMELSGMDLETVTTFVSTVLDLSAHKTRSLAHIIFTKTNGNTFYVIQYLLFLKKNELLWFDDGRGRWDWDEPAIRKEAAVTTTLTDFMKEKLALSDVAPKILPVAACLGARFSRETLGMILADISKVETLQEIIASPSEADVLKSLRLCEKEGFIENCGNKNYSFAHDAMQEAALAVHPARTMQQIRYKAGGVLYRKLNEKELEEKLFVVVNLLNTSQNTSVSPLEIAQLNLKAAEKAKRLSAFSSAATYVEFALLVLPHRSDDESLRGLTLELYSLGAEVEGALGRMDRMQEYCDRVFESTYEYTIFEQLRAQNVLIDCCANVGGQMNIALNRCVGILEELGCSFPKTTVGQGVRSVTSLLKSKVPRNIPQLEDVNSMSLMTDQVKVESMRLLDRLATYSYLEANLLFFLMCTTRMARWTIRYGICDKSPCAFGFLGTVIMHVMGDYKAGSWYGELAVLMVRKLEEMASKDESQRAILTQSQSRATFVAHASTLSWVRPLRDYKDEMIEEGYKCGMRVGDTESAFWSIYFHLGHQLSAGKPLRELEALCRKGISEMIALQKEEAEAYTRIAWQGILNLMKHSSKEGTTELSGSAMHERAYERKEGVWGSKLIPHYFNHMKILLCVFFGDYEQGANIALERGDRFYAEAPGSIWAITDPFLRGMCLFAAASGSKKRLYRRHAEKCRATLRTWVEKGNPTAVHQLKLLDAEHEACAGKRDTAASLYEEACGSALSEGFTQDAALAYERFAEYLFSLPNKADDMEGRNMLTKSIDLYEEWGATAKANLLLKKYPTIAPSKMTLETSETRDASTMAFWHVQKEKF